MIFICSLRSIHVRIFAVVCDEIELMSICQEFATMNVSYMPLVAEESQLITLLEICPLDAVHWLVLLVIISLILCCVV